MSAPNSDFDNLSFEDREPTVVPFSVKGKDGKVKNYVLREGMEDVVCKYQNFLTNSSKLSEGGKMISIGNIHDAEPYLLSLCVFEIVPPKDDKGTETEKPVSITTIRSWPSDRVTKLFEIARKVNHIKIGDTDTVESLEKQIKELQEKLEELKNVKN